MNTIRFKISGFTSQFARQNEHFCASSKCLWIAKLRVNRWNNRQKKVKEQEKGPKKIFAGLTSPTTGSRRSREALCHLCRSSKLTSSGGYLTWIIDAWMDVANFHYFISDGRPQRPKLSSCSFYTVQSSSWDAYPHSAAIGALQPCFTVLGKNNKKKEKEKWGWRMCTLHLGKYFRLLHLRG